MENVTIIISILSLIISIAAISWTIYEKVFLKPRTKVSISLSFVVEDEEASDTMISLCIINYGPGNEIIESIHAQKISFLGKLLRTNKYAFIMQDYTNKYNQRFPVEIGQYKKMTQLIKYEKGCILGDDINRLGFLDSLGRFHYVKGKTLKKLMKEYKTKYGPNEIRE